MGNIAPSRIQYVGVDNEDNSRTKSRPYKDDENGRDSCAEPPVEVITRRTMRRRTIQFISNNETNYAAKIHGTLESEILEEDLRVDIRSLGIRQQRRGCQVREFKRKAQKKQYWYSSISQRR